MKKKNVVSFVFYAKSSFPDARIIVDPVMRVFILSFATLCMNKALSTPLSTLFRLFFERDLCAFLSTFFRERSSDSRGEHIVARS
jgi:hypothetical protein